MCAHIVALSEDLYDNNILDIGLQHGARQPLSEELLFLNEQRVTFSVAVDVRYGSDYFQVRYAI